jgi:DNA repair protein SbcC/Rad50
LGAPFSTDTPAALNSIAESLRAAESELASKEREARKTAGTEAEAKEDFVKLDNEAALLLQAIQSMSEQIAEANREIERLRGQLSGAGDVETIRAGLKAQRAAKQQLTQIEAKIAAGKRDRDEAERQRVNVTTRTAGLKARVEILSKNRDVAKSEALAIEGNLISKLAGLVLPEGRDEAERIDKLLADLGARYSELKRQLVQKEVRFEQLKIRIEEAERKRARIADLECSAFLYGQLGMLLRADQFIRFILEGAFDLLCEEGTRQLLVLSQGRYSFHSDGNDFDVVDHWNADERRSVRTLSGGESFLASLALALALAGSVSQFSEGGPFKLEALFLDEGFSTLDAETLNVAIDALQALQEGDRMIAVISHVADLAERLPGRIQIVKGISGSEIKLDHESSAAIY